MSDVEFKKHRVFRETQDVIFYDISVEESNASDLVVHEGSAVHHQMTLWEQNSFMFTTIKWITIVCLRGERTFELVNPAWKYPYHIVHLNRTSGALIIPRIHIIDLHQVRMVQSL